VINKAWISDFHLSLTKPSTGRPIWYGDGRDY